MTEVLREEPPSRLQIINKEKLSAMGVPEDLTERFLEHPHFSPRHDTIITASLADLAEAKGRDTFLEAILVVDDEVAANFYMNVAQTLQAYNENISPVEKIAVVDGLFVAEARSGAALIPFALDHGVWSARAEQVIGHLKKSYEGQGFSGRYDFWVTGTVSPLARKQLGRLGFTVTENVDETYGFLD